MSEYEARQALQQLFNQYEQKQKVRRGLLGDSNGTVSVANRPGWAYIRYHDNLNELAIVRYLIPEQLADGTPVVVGRKHPDDPYEQVLGVDWTMYAWSPSSSSVISHATDIITLEDLAPGKVVPTDPVSLSVNVRAFLYVNGDTAVEFGGSVLDLTASVPGVAGHRMALVYMDLGADALTVEDGTIVAVGTDASAPAVPENGIPLGLVDLANGETTIEADDISQYKAMYLPVGAEVPLDLLGDYTRGYIIRGGASDWEAYDASGDGYALVGDGTDILSTATPTWADSHTWTSGPQTMNTGNAANIGLVIKAAAAQTANLTEWQDSTGNVELAVNADGDLFTDRWLAQDGNTFIGISVIGAGNLTHAAGTEGYYNTVYGYEAGYSFTTANTNSATGYQAMRSSTTGWGNNAQGYRALYINVAGRRNNAAGAEALRDNLSDDNNAIGYRALMSNSSGNGNNAAGGQALLSNTTGYGNNAVGYVAMYSNVDGYQNSAIGSEALYSNVDGYYNVADGHQALFSNVSGSECVAVGRDAGYSSLGSGNIYLGFSAGYRQTGSNILIIDNQQRADIATELTHSILYGTMAANPEDQQLTINADSLTVGTDAATNVVVNLVAATNSGVLTWVDASDHFLFGDTVNMNHVGLQNIYQQTVTVAKAGGDFAVIQDAIDYAVTQTPSTTNRFCILIHPGDYAETIVGADYVELMGLAAREAVNITGATGPLYTFPDAEGHIFNLKFTLTPTTDVQTIIDVPATVSARQVVSNCLFTVTSASDVATYVFDIKSGEIECINNKVIFTNTNTAGGVIRSQRIWNVSGEAIVDLYGNIVDVDIYDVNDRVYIYTDASLAGGEIHIKENVIRVNSHNAGAYSGVVGFIVYVGQTATLHVAHNFVELSSAEVGGTGAATFVRSNSAGTGLVRSTANHVIVQGFATNYWASAAAGDTIVSHFDNVVAVDGHTGAGTVTYANSLADGTVSLTGTIQGIPDEITATDAGVAASVATINTEVTTNGDADLDNVTLANGISGQIKNIYCVVEGNAADTWKITPATMCGGTQITFAGVGLGCTLVYADNEGWVVVANNGGVIT